MSNDTSTQLQGRLANPERILADDPRADERLIAAITPFGLAGAGEAPPVTISDPMEALQEYCAAAEEGFEGLFVALADGLPAIEGIERSQETVVGSDGNDITLHVHRPSNQDGSVPAVLHLHGGAMAILSTAGPIYSRWRDGLAATGMIVVGVEFRNSAGSLGPHAFPAGLNDCVSALAWLNDNRNALGVSKVIVSGESGGGNLSLATAMKAKELGRTEQVDGVYAQCPYISNLYHTLPDALPSLIENDGYFIRNDMMEVFASIYDGADSVNPLAWPYHATDDDLSGLPPHAISVNELDPLRDEGLVHCENLAAAGVNAVSRTVPGTSHAADVTFQSALADLTESTQADIKRFADSL